MVQIITIKSPDEWAGATKLKRDIKLIRSSIPWMQSRNVNGKFDIAIDEESTLLREKEKLLREFFAEVCEDNAESEGKNLSQAA